MNNTERKTKAKSSTSAKDFPTTTKTLHCTTSLKPNSKPATQPVSTAKPKPAAATATAPVKSSFNARLKVLYVADSLGHTASVKKLENFSNSRIRTARAYSSVDDNKARWPEHNFTDVVKYALGNPGRDKFDVLVMSSPLKPSLARLAIATFNQLWLSSPLKDIISIGCHSLESPGVGDSHLARYKNPNTGRYDGVHFYGNVGCKDYTKSVKTILMLALSEKQCSQPRSEGGKAQSDDHLDCPQSRFQKQRKYQPNVAVKNRFSVFNSN